MRRYQIAKSPFNGSAAVLRTSNTHVNANASVNANVNAHANVNVNVVECVGWGAIYDIGTKILFLASMSHCSTQKAL